MSSTKTETRRIQQINKIVHAEFVGDRKKARELAKKLPNKYLPLLQQHRAMQFGMQLAYSGDHPSMVEVHINEDGSMRARRVAPRPTRRT